MSRRITQTNSIQSGDNSGIEVSGEEKIKYSKHYTAEEFEADELITQSAVVELIDANQPTGSNLAVWAAGTSAGKDDFRTNALEGKEYLFRSTVPENTSEPSFSEGGGALDAWQNLGSVSFSAWNNTSTYNLGQKVSREYSSGIFRLYESQKNGNIGIDPLTSPDSGDANWLYIGTFVGAFDPTKTYSKKDIATDDAFIFYVSLLANNIYGLEEQALSWQKSSETTVDGIALWSSIVNYPVGDYTRRVFSDGTTTYNVVWQSISTGNIDKNPLLGPSVAYWRVVGNYKGLFVEGDTYDETDVVFGEDTGVYNIYISNKPGNDTSIFDSVLGTWQLIGVRGGDMIVSLTFDQSDLTEVYEGNYSLSFSLAVGKSIASIETNQGTLTRRLSPSQAVTDTANSPNTIIEGFDSNSAQTITIKLI